MVKYKLTIEELMFVITFQKVQNLGNHFVLHYDREHQEAGGI